LAGSPSRSARQGDDAVTGRDGIPWRGLWLGEHLVYRLGVGVDTTAFEHLPEDWTDVAAETDVAADGAVRVEVSGVPVLLSRLPDGIVALADRARTAVARCTRAVAECCATCPWHGSTFDLRTGYAVDGPASRPEPRLEVQTLDGRVRVRRAGAGD